MKNQNFLRFFQATFLFRKIFLIPSKFVARVRRDRSRGQSSTSISQKRTVIGHSRIETISSTLLSVRMSFKTES